MAVENQRRTVRGVVVSDKMDKTIVVRTERLVPHPKYRKFTRKYTKYHAHDAQNAARAGDLVELVQTRPLSKLKRWRLLEILRVAPLGEVSAEEEAAQ
ncbi:MAG TPA: 30S ribosomal protein S17 [Planctomycetes bacterium]|nr:30S ribosomal protein S17 [Planctomycetota bacterium]HIN79858.1 30S ribosomal protein S17 [Planctomycetota bacterium]